MTKVGLISLFLIKICFWYLSIWRNCLHFIYCRLCSYFKYECDAGTKSTWESMGWLGQALLGNFVDSFCCSINHCTNADYRVSATFSINEFHQKIHVWSNEKNCYDYSLCVCCCRCAGACGGRSQPFDKKHDTCRRIFLGFFLIIVAIGLV